ncbi:unnamed protein product, partial [Prorocentrum cordatum]
FPAAPRSISGSSAAASSSAGRAPSGDTPPRCRCGAPSRKSNVRKEGPTKDRPYWHCAARRCGFFTWADAEARRDASMWWQRFPEFVIVSDFGFRAEDLRQGGVGDCWFMSALAVVAERPDLILRLFGGETARNAAGCYQIQLFLDGCWQAVLVDDRLPCTSQQRRPDGTSIAYSRADGQQLWSALVEKAYAKSARLLQGHQRRGDLGGAAGPHGLPHRVDRLRRARLRPAGALAPARGVQGQGVPHGLRHGREPRAPRGWPVREPRLQHPRRPRDLRRPLRRQARRVRWSPRGRRRAAPAHPQPARRGRVERRVERQERRVDGGSGSSPRPDGRRRRNLLDGLHALPDGLPSRGRVHGAPRLALPELRDGLLRQGLGLAAVSAHVQGPVRRGHDALPMALQPTKRGSWCREDRKKSYKPGDVSLLLFRLKGDGTVGEVVGGNFFGADVMARRAIQASLEPRAEYLLAAFCFGTGPTAHGGDARSSAPFRVRLFASRPPRVQQVQADQAPQLAAAAVGALHAACLTLAPAPGRRFRRLVRRLASDVVVFQAGEEAEAEAVAEAEAEEAEKEEEEAEAEA